MSNNNQNLSAKGVSLTPSQWERCDRLTERYGKKSRNLFIREAVDFYCVWLEKEHMERFLLPSLESVMDSKIKDSEAWQRSSKKSRRMRSANGYSHIIRTHLIPCIPAQLIRSSKPFSKISSFL